VVVTGGGRGFCAGADLTEGTREPVRRRLALRYAPIIRAMREMEKPVIAAVNGVAAGAGMSLTLAADLRIAAESASFLLAFARIGLVPDAGSTFFLPRLIGLGRAMELAMLAERIPAAEALRIGLVNRVVPDAELTTAAAELAQRLARGPFSLGLIKRALNQSLVSDLPTQLQHEEDLQGLAMASADFVEGVMAFRDKRPAEFQGR
jgi:2-(1,2-epoxy-1,2-dihydrophenyl)acetyl-CoA isomerase